MPNSHRLFSTWSILSWRVFQSLPPCLTEFWLWLRQDKGGGSGAGGGGSLSSCSRLGGFRREKGGREECVVYSHWLRTILLQSWMVSKPAASRRNPSSRVTWCLLRTRPAFVLVCEDHLCHETEVLYEALVSMFRACIDLRLSYIPASAPGWRLRSSHTEQLFTGQQLANSGEAQLKKITLYKINKYQFGKSIGLLNLV